VIAKAFGGQRKPMAGSMDFESLNQLRDTLERHPRMHGYYLLNIEPLPLGWRGNEEASLTKAFEALDGCGSFRA